MLVPMDRFLNMVYFWATDEAEQNEKDKFDIRLNMPDKRARQAGVVPDSSPWSKENEEAALGGFVASLSGGAV